MDAVTTDETLALRAGRGEREAFRLLVERHYDTLFRLSFRFCGNRSEAEDLTQDILTTLPARLITFRGEARFTTWLYRLALNAAADRRRGQARGRARESDYARTQAGAQAEANATAVSSAWLMASLDEIGDPLRATALLVLGEDMTHAEAAEVLAVSPGTVSWRLSELRRKLKALKERDHA